MTLMTSSLFDIIYILFVSSLLDTTVAWTTINTPCIKRKSHACGNRQKQEYCSLFSPQLWAAVSKFSQPVFSLNRTKYHRIIADTSSEHRQNPYGGDGKIAELHQRRVKTAGRVGTKRYVNPCKVFIGNLPFSLTEDDLKNWLCQQMGLPSAFLLHQVKIVRDWQTGQSKGYGFVVFTEPIHATVCIEKCNRKYILDRAVRVDQGVRKKETQVLVKKSLTKPADADEVAIQFGLRQAEAKQRSVDADELAWLHHLDPDLSDDFYQDVADKRIVTKDDDDVETDEFMAINNGSVKSSSPETSSKNRKQRRAEAKQQKSKTKPTKGFGTS